MVFMTDLNLPPQAQALAASSQDEDPLDPPLSLSGIWWTETGNLGYSLRSAGLFSDTGATHPSTTTTGPAISLITNIPK